MATAGSIVIDLLMKTGAFETDTKRAEKRLKEMEKTAKEVGKVIGTAIASGATIATTAIVMWTRDLVVASEEIRRFAQLSNTSTDTFQKWAAGASSVGIQQDKLADILKDMQDRVGDFMQTGAGPMADFFENIAPKVGVTAEQFAKLSGPGALQLFVDSLEKANVAQNDMVFYMEAIASDSTLLLPLLQNNGKAMRELGDQASALGGVLSGETLQAAEEMRQEMWELDQVMRGLKNEVAAGALPVLREFVDLMKDPQAIAAMRDTAELILAIGTAAAKATVGVASLIGKYKEWLANQGFLPTDDDRSMEQLVARQKKLSEQLVNAEDRPTFFRVMFGDDTEAALKKELDQVNAQIKGYAFRGVTASVDSTAFGRGANSGGVIARPKSTGKAEKSEAEKEAEALERAYQSMNERLREQIELFGQNGEAARVRYETEQGALKGLLPAQKEQLIQQAEHIDLLGDVAFHEQLAAEAAEEYNAAVQERQAVVDGVLSDMQFELDLLGMTNKERERAIALRYANVDAASAEGRAILGMADALYEAREQAALLDDVKDGLADMFVDFVSGAKSAKEAFGDFADMLFERALQFVADKAIEAMFDAFSGEGSGGGGGSGGSGGGWGDVFASVLGAFAGGKAGGGDVMASRRYLVGEEGPEMFVPRTAGTIIPAAQTAAMAGGGGGFSQTLQFALAAPTDPRTQQQIAQRVGFETQRASNRNR